MEIKRLYIQNFMAISKAELELDNRGLVLLQGANHDDSSAKSNGSGKSSIPDAINWCLFGETARGESGDNIVNRTAGKDTCVVIDLVDGDKAYIVSRYRKHKEGKNRLVVQQRLDGEDSDLTGGTDRITQETLNTILGCSQEVFSSAIYAAQERMPNLPAMTDKVLKELIEEAAGITQLQAFHAAAKAEHSKCSLELAQLETTKSRLQAAMDVLERTHASTIESRDQWRGRIETDIGTIERTLASYDPTLDDEIKALQAKIADLNKDYAAAKARKPQVDTVLPGLEEALRLAERKVSGIEALQKGRAVTIKEGRAQLETLDAMIGKPCGECGKPYHESDLETARKARTASLNDVIRVYKANQEALSKAIIERDTARQAVDDHRAMPKPEDGSTAALAIGEQIRKAEGSLLGLERVATRRKADEAALAAKQKELTTKNPFDDAVARTETEINGQRTKIDETSAMITEAGAAVTLAEQAVQVFSPAGVRAHILDGVTPYLNARTARYLSVLSDGNISATWTTLSETAKGELRERFAIDVVHAKGGASFGLLSGGEKRKVRLACALALQDLVSTRATRPFRLFIADEIDDALDGAGLERLMTILDEKARERGTVLVISHNSLSDWIRDVVTVEKRGGKSTVSGVLCPGT